MTDKFCINCKENRNCGIVGKNFEPNGKIEIELLNLSKTQVVKTPVQGLLFFVESK